MIRILNPPIFCAQGTNWVSQQLGTEERFHLSEKEREMFNETCTFLMELTKHPYHSLRADIGKGMTNMQVDASKDKGFYRTVIACGDHVMMQKLDNGNMQYGVQTAAMVKVLPMHALILQRVTT